MCIVQPDSTAQYIHRRTNNKGYLNGYVGHEQEYHRTFQTTRLPNSPPLTKHAIPSWFSAEQREECEERIAIWRGEIERKIIATPPKGTPASSSAASAVATPGSSRAASAAASPEKSSVNDLAQNASPNPPTAAKSSAPVHPKQLPRAGWDWSSALGDGRQRKHLGEIQRDPNFMEPHSALKLFGSSKRHKLRARQAQCSAQATGQPTNSSSSSKTSRSTSSRTTEDSQQTTSTEV